MADVKAHYDNLLAPYYSWIFGGLESKLEENRNFFRGHGIQPVLSGVAMDLGAGCGFQSIPLAEAGFKVTAIDISHTPPGRFGKKRPRAADKDDRR